MTVRRVAALTLSALRRLRSGHCWPSSFTPVCTLHADEATNGVSARNRPTARREVEVVTHGAPVERKSAAAISCTLEVRRAVLDGRKLRILYQREPESGSGGKWTRSDLSAVRNRAYLLAAVEAAIAPADSRASSSPKDSLNPRNDPTRSISKNSGGQPDDRLTRHGC